MLEKRENQEHLFPLLWILGFSILSEILLFVMQRLGRSLIEWMQAFVPEGIAPLLISDLTAALSALFPLLIFAIGIRLYALGRKEQLPRQVRIVAVALFLCGHTAAAALSGVLVSFFGCALGCSLSCLQAMPLWPARSSRFCCGLPSIQRPWDGGCGNMN